MTVMLFALLGTLCLTALVAFLIDAGHGGEKERLRAALALTELERDGARAELARTREAFDLLRRDTFPYAAPAAPEGVDGAR